MKIATKKIREPRVSVIIAAYNEENHIEHCLETLVSQSLRPYEIIVVDDGSVDSTWEKLSALSKRQTLVKIYHKKHFEQATARNYGFSKSSGEILVFPDADYYFDRDFIKKLIAPIAKEEAIATYPTDELVANPENIWSECWNINAYLSPGKRLSANHPIRANNFRAIRRREFESAGGFSETGYTNDITVLNKLRLKEAGLSVRGAICYHYNPDSLQKVFASAFRKGSKGGISPTLVNFFIFSPFNTLRRGVLESIKHHKPQFILFKLAFDSGIILGLIFRLVERKSQYQWGKTT